MSFEPGRGCNPRYDQSLEGMMESLMECGWHIFQDEAWNFVQARGLMASMGFRRFGNNVKDSVAVIGWIPYVCVCVCVCVRVRVCACGWVCMCDHV